MAKKKKGPGGPRRRQLGRPGGAFEFFGPSPARDLAIEQGMSEAAFGSLSFIASVDNPANPPCAGPVVIHADGSIECEGDCAGVAFAYHGAGSTVSCEVHGPSTSHTCSGCESVGDNSVDQPSA